MSGLLHTGGGSMGFVDFVIAVKRRHVFGISLPCADHLGAALAQRLNKALYLFFVHLAAIILLTGCADKPVVVAVDTLCTSTSRPARSDSSAPVAGVRVTPLQVRAVAHSGLFQVVTSLREVAALLSTSNPSTRSSPAVISCNLAQRGDHLK